MASVPEITLEASLGPEQRLGTRSVVQLGAVLGSHFDVCRGDFRPCSSLIPEIVEGLRARPVRGLTRRNRSVRTCHSVVTRSLPSWRCEFDPRHPLSFADVRTRPWLSWSSARAMLGFQLFRLAPPLAISRLFRVLHGTSMAHRTPRGRPWVSVTLGEMLRKCRLVTCKKC